MEKYFTSKGSMYEFFLLELSGEQRAKKLGVTKTHYFDNVLATKWYENIYKEIKSREAKEQLQTMYGKMIDLY
jgi:hypothetical protein